MSKMQPIKFDSMDELWEFLPEDQLKVVNALRELIFDCIPEVTERLSYNVPFYKVHKGICFIWPGAVAWGKQIKQGVDFGFNYGYLLTDEYGYMEMGKRKQVTMRNFKSVRDIDFDMLRSLIYEAVIVDQESTEKKKKKTINY